MSRLTEPPFMFPLPPAVNVNVNEFPVLFAVAVVGETVIAPSPSAIAAMGYGPTNGPPPAAAPAGSIEVLLLPDIARARFRRPFPVWLLLPTGSAFAASRFTITPFVALAD